MLEFITNPAVAGALGGGIVAIVSGYLALRTRPTQKVQNQGVLVDAAEDVVQMQRQAISDLTETVNLLKSELAALEEKHKQEVSAMKGSITRLKNRVEALERQVKDLGHEPVAE